MASNRTSRFLSTWNKKLHIYFGLFSILFLWLFSVSGLILNHPQWFAGFKPDRVKSERPVEMPLHEDSLAKANALKEQLGIKGEIVIRKGPSKPGQFGFLALKPNLRTFVNVNLESGIATVTNVTPNSWAALSELHTFTGVRGMWNESSPTRDWFFTQIWSFSMDALSVGLIFLVISSLYMWYQLKQNRLWGVVAFGLGVFVCAFFIWGLVLLV